MPVRLSYSAKSAAIQQCFSLTINQRTILSATINQRNEQTDSYHNFRSHGTTRLAARLGQIPSHKKEAKETVLRAEL
jgi:hypothetical protein